MKLENASIWAILVILLAVPAGAAQETTGTIVEIVVDATGAVVVEARVAVTNLDRNAVVRTLTTDEDGAFVAPLLPIGHYAVKVEAPGFKAFVADRIELNVNDRFTLKAELASGDIN